MNKQLKYLALIWIILGLVQALKAQTEHLPIHHIKDSTSSIIKTNPFAILWGPIPFTAEYRLVYEAKVFKGQSILIGGSLLGKSMMLTMAELIDTTMQYQAKTVVRGFRLQLEYRFYFKNKYDGRWGYYLTPHFSFSKAQFTDDYYRLQGYATEFRYLDYGLIAGNQNVIGKSALDIWFGLGYKKNIAYWIQPNKIEEIEDFESFSPDVKFYFGFNFGIAQ